MNKTSIKIMLLSLYLSIIMSLELRKQRRENQIELLKVPAINEKTLIELMSKQKKFIDQIHANIQIVESMVNVLLPNNINISSDISSIQKKVTNNIFEYYNIIDSISNEINNVIFQNKKKIELSMVINDMNQRIINDFTTICKNCDELIQQIELFILDKAKTFITFNLDYNNDMKILCITSGTCKEQNN